MRSGSRLVATRRRRRRGREQLGERCAPPRAAAARGCRGRRAPASRRCAAAIAAMVSPEAPSCSAIIGTTSAGSRTGASGTKTVPASASSARNRASSIENRVLPVPPGPDDREHPRVTVEPQGGGLEELVLAAEEVSAPGWGGRRLRASAAAGTGTVPSWKSCAGSVEVLEPVPPEVLERLVLDERRGRDREDHLPAVGERRDPGAAVDVDADVALGGHGRSARVEAHAHGDRPGSELPLSRAGRRDGACRGREGDEEGISLGVDLHASVVRRTRRGGRGGARRAPRRSARARAAAAAASSPRCR